MQVSRWMNRDSLAVAAGLGAPLVVTAVLVPFRTSFANTDAALVLLLVVVAVAATGYRLAGFLAAISTAVWFDFFLTRPYESFAITSRVDIQTTILLLAIGAAVTEIAVWGRRQHSAATRRAGYLDGIEAAAQAAAAGDSPTVLIEDVSRRLARLLSLRSCTFQYGVAGVGSPARLQQDGQVIVARQPWNVAAQGLPAGKGLELLVESGGLLRGRFLMTPEPGARPSREQLLVAVAFAGQVGAALAGGQAARR